MQIWTKNINFYKISHLDMKDDSLLLCYYTELMSLASHFTVNWLWEGEMDVVAKDAKRVQIIGLDLGVRLNETKS